MSPSNLGNWRGSDYCSNQPSKFFCIKILHKKRMHNGTKSRKKDHFNRDQLFVVYRVLGYSAF